MIVCGLSLMNILRYKKYTETRAQASLAMSFEITDKQYEFPDVSGCKKVLALGLGGGCGMPSLFL